MQVDKVNFRKMIAVVGVAVLFLSLLPMLYVSRYNHPTGDDIYYGLAAHLAYAESGNVFQAIEAAINGVATDYYTWQGTFVAMLIMRLQPSVFSEQLYFLTPFIVLGLVLGGFYYLLSRVGEYILPMDIWDKLSVWSICSFVMIQWVHAIGDAFYWFNGSVYYTGFFGIFLFAAGVCIEYLVSGKKRNIPQLLILSIMLGGSNYITLLISLILLTLLWIWLLCKRCKGWSVVLLTDIVLFGCFVISAMAPGNAVRQAHSASLPAMKAILFSLLQGFAYIEAWASGWWLLGFVFLLPTMMKLIMRSRFSFRYPGIVVGFLYGLFCAMQCPTMYAEASTGPGRVLNVIWYGFVLFSYLALFYIVGWMCRKVYVNGEIEKANMTRIWMFGTMMLLVIQGGIGLKNDSIKNMSSLKAVSDITSGRAKAYHGEYIQRLDVLYDETVQVVKFSEFANKPKTVYVGDYSPDSEAAANMRVAKWYGKESVCVIYEQ